MTSLQTHRRFETPFKLRRRLNSTLLSTDEYDKTRRFESPFRLRRRIRSVLYSVREDTWSQSGTKRSSVRSRVKNVLAKARGRTGIRNGSEKPTSSASDIIEAASIGGLGTVNGDVSPSQFDYIPPNSTDDDETSPCEEIDSFSSDVSAAFSIPEPAIPLPFEIPELTPIQMKQVLAGERVQFQKEMGLEGYGFVVIDVKAPASVVWDCLLDFHSYPQLIPTVREMEMYTNTHLDEDYYHEDKVEYEDGSYAVLKHGVPSVTRAAFTLSKFKLKIAAIHKYRPHPDGDYMIFSLDPANRNIVLQNAKGIWHTQSNPKGRTEKGYTRVWLLCELRVSKLLPKFIVDYAAQKAMPRATTWLKPQVEAAATLWLKDRS